MAKKMRPDSNEFFHEIQKRNEEFQLHKSPEKKKMDELESALLSSRRNWRESKEKVTEAQKLIKQLQGQIKDLKEANAILQHEIMYAHKYMADMKKELVIAKAKKK
jgi:seryl-tRNA synthetase